MELFTVLGWEERFIKGLKTTLKKEEFQKVHLIVFDDYLNRMEMENNLNIAKNIIDDHALEFNKITLRYSNSINNWNTLNDYFSDKSIEAPFINLTTIPRETIWTLLFFLRIKHNKIKYNYFKPKTYTESWLTKNYKEPRLLFKHSGLFNLEKKLALIVIRGFDKSRLHQLVDFFEPNHLSIFTQATNNFEIEREELNKTKFSPEININKYNIDSYDYSASLEKIENEVVKLKSEFNIIIASQGPKVSSLYTYKCQINNPEIALAYVPAIDFNIDYSNGCDLPPISGDLNL